MTLSGACNTFEITSSGVGNVYAFALVAQNGNITILGTGNVEVTVVDLLDVSINGAGNVSYKGNPAITSVISKSGRLIDEN
jgi:hypothetical protein